MDLLLDGLTVRWADAQKWTQLVYIAGVLARVTLDPDNRAIFRPAQKLQLAHHGAAVHQRDPVRLSDAGVSDRGMLGKACPHPAP